MIPHYRDYFWKAGKPYGREVVDANQHSSSYKIVPDPYHRRFSIEKYCYGQFEAIIYDSYLLDFRRLKAIENMAWQKETLEEKQDQSTIKCLLRDPDDRAVLMETYIFEQQKCRACHISSIHGLLIATHYLYYQALKDPVNAVVLYDLENRPIMFKTYDVDESTGEFSNLLIEEWDMQEPSQLLNSLKPLILI